MNLIKQTIVFQYEYFYNYYLFFIFFFKQLIKNLLLGLSNYMAVHNLTRAYKKDTSLFIFLFLWRDMQSWPHIDLNLITPFK
jgi:hypothetical protein